MEYVEGRDLQAIVKQDGPVEFAMAAEYIRQAAEALGHAHDASIIHRDIKPANLLLDTKGTVKLLDLGLARFCDGKKGSLTLDHDENVLGTADYLSPEQAINSHEVDTRADIYSLGCTFYYLLTGHPPFNEGTLSQRLLMHQKEAPPSIFVDRPDAPNDLVNICVRMMVKDAKGRYQTCREVSKVLSEWLVSQGRQIPTGGSSAHLAAAAAGQQAAAGRPETRPAQRRPPGTTPGQTPAGEPVPPVTGETLASSADETAKAQSRRSNKPPVARSPAKAKERLGPPKLPSEKESSSGDKLRIATPLGGQGSAANDEFPEFSIDAKAPKTRGRAKAATGSKTPSKPSVDTQIKKADTPAAAQVDKVAAQPLWKTPLLWAVAVGVVVLGCAICVIVYLLTQ
jgi:serine/threonine-protein kinase